MKKTLRFMYFAVCAFFMLSTYAFAYLDPSTMTYLIQVIAGVFIAGGATAGILWHKFKRAIKKPKNNASDAQATEAAANDEPDEDEAD